MLKLKLILHRRLNHYYFDFVDEFSKESWNGITFQTLDEAVEFAKENITWKNQKFDLVSICKPKYLTEER